MKPVDFPQANAQYGPPPDLTESQVAPVQAYQHVIQGGSCDGLQSVVVAWQPDLEDLRRLFAGGRIYLSCIGGLPPHFLTTTFQDSIRVA